MLEIKDLQVNYGSISAGRQYAPSYIAIAGHGNAMGGGFFGNSATLLVNMTACLVIGFSMTFLERRADFNPAWRFLIPIGFIGAYSTFSTYEWETLAELRSGAFLMATLYAGGSLILGLIAVWGGSALADAL